MPMIATWRAAVSLARVLPTLPRLRELALMDCRVGDEGACALASAVVQCPKLQLLDLMRNVVADIGAKAIAKHIALFPPSLRKLYLNENHVSELAMDALLTASSRHPFLSKKPHFLEQYGLHLITTPKMGKFGVVSGTDAEVLGGSSPTSDSFSSGTDIGGEDNDDCERPRVRGHGREEPHLNCPAIAMRAHRKQARKAQQLMDHHT